ncbi:MAG: hypothetical protein ACI9VR_000521 [Cognaticolwellia sp.]|jgi:hypothetical protein
MRAASMRAAFIRASDTWVAGLALLGSGATASYVLQRLIDAGSEPPIGTVLAQEHIPYYWRMAVALLHGLVLAALSIGLPQIWRVRMLQWAPVWVGTVCVCTLIAMLAVP